MTMTSAPKAQGLYDPKYEHDACGVGFIADLKNRQSHDLVLKALQILRSLEHRGACGCEVNTGDGAGILLQIPHKFMAEATRRSRFDLPAAGEYGCGLVFLPRNMTLRRRLEERFRIIVESEGQSLIGWRNVPTDNSMIGETA